MKEGGYMNYDVECEYCEDCYYQGCCWGCIGEEGAAGPQGATGLQGPTGPQGVTGEFMLSSYMTAKSVGSIVPPNEKILFGGAISKNGANIMHLANTTEFTLAGGHTYFIQFSVNGISQERIQGFFFALMVGEFITDSRVASQNTANSNGYNSGAAYHFLRVRDNTTASIQIVNIGLDTIDLANANISILQISN